MTLHSVVINMGPHKTGSSAIAQYLSEAKQKNALAASLLYPTGSQWLNSQQSIVKHAELARFLFPREGDGEKGGSRHALETTFANLRREAEQRGLEKVTTVLVSELMNDMGDPNVLEEFLSHYFDEITLVVFCRKQDSAVSSMISQSIKMWSRPAKSTDLDDYLTDGLYFPEDFDYLRSSEKWAKISDRCTIVFVPYLEGEEGSSALIERFFAAARLGSPPDSDSLRPNKANRALSKECLDVMGKIKAQRDLLEPGGPAWEQLRNQFWDVLRRFEFMAVAEGRGSTSFENPWVLESAERRRIQQAYQESNTAFLKKIDRSSFAAEWDTWEESIQPASLATEGAANEAPTRLVLDVTGMPDTSYPSMRSALSIAEARGQRFLQECTYVAFDQKIEAYRIVSREKSLVFRNEHGPAGHARMNFRRLFNSSRKKLWRLRFILPPAGFHVLRSVYENFLSEAKVTTINKNVRSWPVWVPSTSDAVAFVADPTNEKHHAAQIAARAGATEVSLRPRG